MRNILFVGSALAFAMLSALPLEGCDGGDDGTGGKGGGGTGGGASVAEACKSLSSALCGHLEKCSPYLLEVTYGDRATCETRVDVRCDDPIGLDSSNSSADVISACAAAYEARACTDLLSPTPEQCRVPGDRDDGATCAAPSQCKGNLCLADAEGSCGTCATPLAEGASCGGSDVCENGLYCGSSGKCQKTAGLGETCDVDHYCAQNLSCNSGKCGPLLEEGDDCSSGEVCNLGSGVICFAFSSTCTKLGISKLGETCGFNENTGEVTTCEAGATCTEDGVCVAQPKEGEECAIDPDSGNGNCISGLDCIGGKCTAGLPECQ